MPPPPAAVLARPLEDDEPDLSPAEHDAAWETEIEQRIADVREGRVQTIPWEDVQAKARAILAASKARGAAAR